MKPKLLLELKVVKLYIPRIPMITNEYPFEFKQVHFPIKLCFAISINKAQGKTMKVVGSDNTDPCFIYGQFYLAPVSAQKKTYTSSMPQNKKPIILFIKKF